MGYENDNGMLVWWLITGIVFSWCFLTAMPFFRKSKLEREKVAQLQRMEERKEELHEVKVEQERMKLRKLEKSLSKPVPDTDSSDGESSNKGGNKKQGKLQGTLIGFGQARYRFDKKKNKSFFVRLDINGKSKEVWGIELEKALLDADADKGDYITLERLERKNVQVQEKEYDGDGQFVGYVEKSASRQDWACSVIKN